MISPPEALRFRGLKQWGGKRRSWRSNLKTTCHCEPVRRLVWSHKGISFGHNPVDFPAAQYEQLPPEVAFPHGEGGRAIGPDG